MVLSDVFMCKDYMANIVEKNGGIGYNGTKVCDMGDMCMAYLKKALIWFVLMVLICSASGIAQSKLVLPAGVKEIHAEAFSGVETADEIVLHDSIQYIADDAFAGSDNLTAIVFPGSYAHIWCLEKEFPYKVQLAVGDRLNIDFEYAQTTYIAVESSNPRAASVDESGMISGLSAGETCIVMSGEDGSSIDVALEVIGYAEAHRALCVAHRGASGYYRENTIKAFEYAHALGADIAELDVHKTKDGVIVVFHDKKIKSGDTKKAVASLTYKALIKLDSRICTLQEAIECIEKTDMKVMVEFKATGITEDVINIVEAGCMGDRALYSGFDLDTLLEVKQLRPDAETAYSINSLSLLEKIIASPEDYNIDIAGVNHNYLTADRVRDLHLVGKDVYAWTVNTKSRIAECVTMGVDGVLTNYPDYM